MDDKQVLLNRIQICDFVLTEVNLYLDTHPNDKAALDYYKKHLDMRNEAHALYVKKYGPLTSGDYDGGPTWNWVDGPWPWQIAE